MPLLDNDTQVSVLVDGWAPHCIWESTIKGGTRHRLT